MVHEFVLWAPLCWRKFWSILNNFNNYVWYRDLFKFCIDIAQCEWVVPIENFSRSTSASRRPRIDRTWLRFVARCRLSLRRTSKSRFSDSGTRSRRIGPRSRIVFGDRASTTPKKTSPTSVDPSLKVWNDVLTSKRKIITCSQCKNYLLTWGSRHSDSSRETVGSILCATNSFFIMIQSKLCCLGIAGCGIVLKGFAHFSWSVPLHCGTWLRPQHWDIGKERRGK